MVVSHVGEPNLERGPVEPASTHLRAVEYVIGEVAERLDERFTLEELASLVFFSPYHFHRIFRQVTGLPPGRFFGALRIEAAKRLLLTSDLSVGEVCLEVGYRSIGTFTSQFSRLVGVSPRTFRNLGRTNGSLPALAPPSPPAGAVPARPPRRRVGTSSAPTARGAFTCWPSRWSRGCCTAPTCASPRAGALFACVPAPRRGPSTSSCGRAGSSTRRFSSRRSCSPPDPGYERCTPIAIVPR